jgi:hypothetical protein
MLLVLDYILSFIHADNTLFSFCMVEFERIWNNFVHKCIVQCIYVWLHGDLSVDQLVIREDTGLNSWEFAVFIDFCNFTIQGRIHTIFWVIWPLIVKLQKKQTKKTPSKIVKINKITKFSWFQARVICPGSLKQRIFSRMVRWTKMSQCIIIAL